MSKLKTYPNTCLASSPCLLWRDSKVCFTATSMMSSAWPSQGWVSLGGPSDSAWVLEPKRWQNFSKERRPSALMAWRCSSQLHLADCVGELTVMPAGKTNPLILPLPSSSWDGRMAGIWRAGHNFNFGSSIEFWTLNYSGLKLFAEILLDCNHFEMTSILALGSFWQPPFPFFDVCLHGQNFRGLPLPALVNSDLGRPGGASRASREWGLVTTTQMLYLTVMELKRWLLGLQMLQVKPQYSKNLLSSLGVLSSFSIFRNVGGWIQPLQCTSSTLWMTRFSCLQPQLHGLSGGIYSLKKGL